MAQELIVSLSDTSIRIHTFSAFFYTFSVSPTLYQYLKPDYALEMAQELIVSLSDTFSDQTSYIESVFENTEGVLCTLKVCNLSAQGVA